MVRESDVVIVGGGAAGLSAALILGRARRSVVLVDDGHPRNAVVEEMHGFLSRDGVPPHTLREAADAELVRYPSIERVSASITSAEKRGQTFVVTLASGSQISSTRLLLATGVFDQLPSIDGLQERWGKSVFVCPFCDGWEHRDRRIAVYGAGRTAVELAQEIYGWSHDVVVCADRDDLTEDDRRWIDAAGLLLKIGRPVRLAGKQSGLERIEFEDDSEVSCDALFISAPLRQHSPLVQMLGCALTETQAIDVNATYETSVPGCYAAGDAVTHVHQVIVAAASGARAAIALTSDLLQSEAAALVRENTS